MDYADQGRAADWPAPQQAVAYPYMGMTGIPGASYYTGGYAAAPAGYAPAMAPQVVWQGAPHAQYGMVGAHGTSGPMVHQDGVAYAAAAPMPMMFGPDGHPITMAPGGVHYTYQPLQAGYSSPSAGTPQHTYTNSMGEAGGYQGYGNRQSRRRGRG